MNTTRYFDGLRLRLVALSRARKRILVFVVDAIALITALCGSVFLIFGQWPTDLPVFSLLLTVVAAGIGAGLLVGFYRSVIRFAGVDMLRVAVPTTVFACVAASIVLLFYLPPLDVFRIAVVCLSFMLVGLLGARFVARLMLNRRRRNREPVIIYGAGDAGVRLSAALTYSPRFLAIAMVDDDPARARTRIDGLDVLPSTQLPRLIESTGAKRVLLAIPSASRNRRQKVLDRLERLPVRVQTIPDVGDIVSGRARVDDLRDIPMEDLLGRDPVPPRQELLRQENQHRVVMVTGAGGSIGSELCRQLLTVEPAKILLVEHSEIALYNIERSLTRAIKERQLNVKLVALLANVKNRKRIASLIKAFRVETVYHAAAYKHVPIVEHNVFEGVLNNVFGTLSVVEACIEHRVKRMVLVSTDKAVSPTNVMGASKRLAEQILQAYASNQKQTKLCMVRFGNVLASSGSVVPLFREQIRNGGPVTVTHPDIIRYFMTIPEASQLVIQAGAMAAGGDVFVLDMGEPVKIVDLAQRLVKLLGKTIRDENNPDGDIEIVYTGLRPAEKLYEELLIGKNVMGTQHPRIMRAAEQYPEFEDLQNMLDRLRNLVEQKDHTGLRQFLLDHVEGYAPTVDFEDHLHVAEGRPNTTKVTRLDDYQQSSEV